MAARELGLHGKNSGVVRARVAPPDEKAMAEAARKLGLSLSAWVRMVLLERLAEMRAKGTLT